MKKTLMFVGLLVGSMMLTTGCGTPGLNPAERDQKIVRNWSYEGGQAIDDFDTVMLLRPASRLTIWNVQ